MGQFVRNVRKVQRVTEGYPDTTRKDLGLLVGLEKELFASPLCEQGDYTGYNTLTTVELITRQEIARYKRSNNIKYKKKRIKS